MARRLLLLLLPVLHVWGAERGAASTARGVQPAADSGSASRDVSATLPDCSVPREYLSGGGALPALQRIPVAITSGGKARTFLLILPMNMSTAQPRPLVLALSGMLDDAVKLLDVSDVYPDGPASVHVDVKATAAGYVVVAPNSLCDSPVANGTCAWGSTTTVLDPAHAAGSVLKTDEMPFFVDAVRCVRDVLRVPLSGDVYAMGFSQGGKLASRFGCEGAAASGGELRVRAVAAAEALYTAQPALRGACAAGASDAAPPPMLLFQAQNEDVVPFCIAGKGYAPTNLYWSSWAGVYNGCLPAIPLVPGSTEISPPIMQAFCAPDAATLPPVAAEKEMVATSAARAANATRLLRVYTNGLKWCGLRLACCRLSRMLTRRSFRAPARGRSRSFGPMRQQGICTRGPWRHSAAWTSLTWRSASSPTCASVAMPPCSATTRPLRRCCQASRHARRRWRRRRCCLRCLGSTATQQGRAWTCRLRRGRCRRHRPRTAACHSRRLLATRLLSLWRTRLRCHC